METAPKLGRDVPPKKDKLQAKKKKPRRYWEEETPPTAAGAFPGPPRKLKRNRELRPQKPKNIHIRKKSRISKKPQVPKKPRERGPQRSLSGAQDPFAGPAPVPGEVVQKFRRVDKSKKLPRSKSKTRSRLEAAEAEEEEVSVRAARSELLLAEEPGFLEGEDGEDTARIRQADIVEAVDIASAAKHFDLNLRQFGPYRLNYSRTGRHLAFGGRRGHVAALDWVTKKLMCEINVMEAVRDIRFLHSEALLAVAQNRWLHIYDNQGIELHCIRRCDRVTRLEFLPFHFLLATASETGFLTYLDVSVGKIVAALNARAGRLDVMTQNPYNAVIHLGHSNGTVSLWSPAMKEPLAKILCHRGGVRAVAVDSTGTHMATSGVDHQLKIFDLRGTFQPLSARTLPQGAGHLAFSQRGLLAAGMGDVVNVWAGQCKASPPLLEQPYLTHRLSGHVHSLQFCPFEDVLGVGHSGGITSMLIPGAAEPNFDGLENNPYRSQKQRQEWEVKALLEKVPAELICLDPRALAEVDVISLEQKKKERIERLGYDPEAKAPFQPKPKRKGRSSTASLVKRKRKVMDEEHRDRVRQSLEEQLQKQEKAAKPTGARPSALDRFVR
ncbi:WD repeat-containing protein 46 [Camelus dromedarius]|uniref:WD repeat-containing protein 46 n=2 Tax=Camelus TaxID=9836 RepID=A0A5N4CST0_CAMDR|nr:WD repeat-containing protein 46 [Camelus bactrianus]XP_010992860.1 WD repeat-containing protein 46 [Camelus dromedarius]KAB1261891.1 WD repeat-containing protein 46 [Camelus dromedarius]KAB1261892.1 WD repeat-containing protein 46 [Camelus dromedarius]